MPIFPDKLLGLLYHLVDAGKGGEHEFTELGAGVTAMARVIDDTAQGAHVLATSEASGVAHFVVHDLTAREHWTEAQGMIR